MKGKAQKHKETKGDQGPFRTETHFLTQYEEQEHQVDESRSCKKINLPVTVPPRTNGYPGFHSQKSL